MNSNNTVIGVFADHTSAEAAVKTLTEAGFEMKHLTIVGKGYETDEKVVGFYNVENRMMFWGKRGAFWGGLWGLFFGGIFLTVPVIGPVVVLGYLGTVIVSGIETALLVGALSVFGAALYSIGIPKNSVLEYETALKADQFLVMAHGPANEMKRAEEVLGTLKTSKLTSFENAAAYVA
jgi:hypothetical protein